jgi:hypothetical protein
MTTGGRLLSDGIQNWRLKQLKLSAQRKEQVSGLSPTFFHSPKAVKRGSVGGRWKSVQADNSLAAYPTERPVLKTSRVGDCSAEFNNVVVNWLSQC